MKCEPGSRDSVISIGFKANQMLKRCCLDDCVINQKYSAQITGYSLECVLTHVSFAIASAMLDDAEQQRDAATFEHGHFWYLNK